MKIKRYFLPKRQVYSLLKMLFLQITVSENGYSTKMTSFDDYLIEIKTSSTKANGYTMEYSSLDQNFMTKLLTNHKKIYAWTVNNESVMTGMILMGVNGIITDYLTTSQGGKQR